MNDVLPKIYIFHLKKKKEKVSISDISCDYIQKSKIILSVFSKLYRGGLYSILSKRIIELIKKEMKKRDFSL